LITLITSVTVFIIGRSLDKAKPFPGFRTLLEIPYSQKGNISKGSGWTNR